MTTAAAAASQTSSTKTNSSTTNTNTVMGKDDFMKLLLAQMKYQDPLSPMEGTEYASQLAQFSSLEQLTNLNENMTSSINTNYLLTQSIGNTMSATLIGKEVKINSSNITVGDQSSVGIGVDLPSNAKSVKIKIYNEAGALVKEIEKDDLVQGEHKLSWDCTDNSGKKVTKGNYTYKMEAVSNTGKNMTVSPYVWGTIDSLKFTDSGSYLVINGTKYGISDILEINNSTTK